MQLPIDFEHEITEIVGKEEYQRLADALAEDPSVSVRINRKKPCRWEEGNDLIDDKVAWCCDGFYLKSRPSFTFDPLLHSGAYYVQEASSMFLDHVLEKVLDEKGNSTLPIIMLDMCAAPGGKSTIARSRLPEGSLLMANEPIGKRVQILAENIQKQGYANTIVTNNYPKDYARSGLMFDMILCDVPCSGEGMFRKDIQAVEEWSLRNVEKCQALQREIVADAWKCLKPDGTLIYSTCTFNTRENEENIKWIVEELGGEIVEIPIEESWGITGSLLKGFNKPVYRFIQGRTRGEGLFMAVIRKLSDEETISRKAKQNKDKAKNKKKNGSIDLSCYLKSADNFSVIEEKDQIIAFPKNWEHIYKLAQKHLHIVHSGITIGQQKGRDIVPDQSLALSIELSEDAFPKAELEYDEAISYLRKEAITLAEDKPRGYVLVTYKGLPLGFVKNIGNRANNLYPSEWRIRKIKD